VSDRIEVIENASSGGTDLSRSLPSARRSSGGSRVNVSTRRIEVEIEPARVIQIQEALLKRGFFSGETTGVYDDATVDAMRQFQINQKIDATGYPTAQSLKLLGL
jgi:peptidoglycan hydrolase-like protein with peptidoglycan-binding domain